MNRNVESHFALNPTSIDIRRSKFDRSSSVKTSFNVGQLIPFYVDEVLPGDTFNVKTSKVVRLQTLITPMMDNLYLDTYYFFVPNRLTWSHWKEFMGENTASAWLPQVEYSIPQIEAPASTGWNVGTIADYFGIPTGIAGLSVSALPFRAYALICNEWFRDENLSDPVVVPLGDSTQTGSNGGTFVNDLANGGLPYLAAKYHDYFTSALPAPQKGPDVAIPVADTGLLPVYAFEDQVPTYTGSETLASNLVAQSYMQNASDPRIRYGTIGSINNSSPTDFATAVQSDFTKPGNLPQNLFAVNLGTAAAATINQLRLAFQIQKLYERDARGGTRYIEILKSHFGVTSPDARLQRPEYLGGNRVPIRVSQIVQQSASDQNSPMGNVAAMSLTTDVNGDFTRSFTEHGYVIGLMVARYDHTYQQGIERMWSRRKRFDYYWPVFANIGEQAILNKEIYAQGTNDDEEVFGYQEAWAEYRYKPNRVSGEMRSSYTLSLDKWHLADDYASLPALSDAWIREDKNNVDRVLAVTSAVSNQLFADIYVKNMTTRPMPVYSVPGLIDHH